MAARPIRGGWSPVPRDPGGAGPRRLVTDERVYEGAADKHESWVGSSKGARPYLPLGRWTRRSGSGNLLGVADRCTNLNRVLGAYLHQDFDLDFASAEEALSAAVAGQDQAQVRAAASELRTCRPSRDDEEASCAFTNKLCSYHPPADGLTYAGWLDHVQLVLEAATGA